MVKWILLTLGLIVLFFSWSMSRTYKDMFSLDHYREVAHALETLRRAANQSQSTASVDSEEGEPATIMTSQFANIAYSISKDEGGFQHHISFSTPRVGHTTRAAGEIFVSFFAWRMGLDPTQCNSFSLPAAYHLVFSIADSNQTEFMARPLALPDEIDLETVRAETARIREQIAFWDATEQLEQERARHEATIESG